MSGETGIVTETKSFHIGDILSVVGERLVSPEHIGGVYKLLGWMVDEDLMTHQLTRVSRECAPFLSELFPDLAAIDNSDVIITSEAECLTWLASIEPEYGTHRDVPRLPRVDHTEIDPIAEIKMIRPDLPIIRSWGSVMTTTYQGGSSDLLVVTNLPGAPK